jgi:hypothetical protein
MTGYALGLVVNPKLARPVLAYWDGREMDILALDDDEWLSIGTGYYGDTDDPATSATGYPRSHTPSGVQIKKQGYGTCLYTALCLGAHHNADGALRLFRYGPDGDGISSESNSRSTEADHWWSRAKDLGLASEVVEDQTEESVDVTSELSELVSGQEVDGKLVSYVNTINVDVEASVTADVYPYDRAEDHDLVLAEFVAELPFTGVESLWTMVQQREPTELKLLVHADRILACDVRGLSVSAMNLLGILAERGGAPEEDLHALRFRWEHGLDPGAPVKQMRLPFKANSSEAREAAEILKTTKMLRAETGWDDLRTLP